MDNGDEADDVVAAPPPRLLYGNFTIGKQYTLRTNEAHRANADKWLAARSHTARQRIATQTGSKWSQLLRLPYFSAPEQCVLDGMHAVHLGVVRLLVEKWKEEGVLNKSVLDDMQKKMDLIDVPGDLGRICRKIASNFASLKAAELKNFCVYFGDYLLRPHLSASEVRISICLVCLVYVFTHPDSC